jgi:hypothetical protein
VLSCLDGHGARETGAVLSRFKWFSFSLLYLFSLQCFVLGCGGYIYDEGVVFSPNNLSDIDNVTECIWFVEAGKNDYVIFLKRNRNYNVTDNDKQEHLMTVSILF